MASVVAEPVHEIPHWLKTLPVAPEFHPTVAEFEDPISYILKIEKQASRYGICKIVPPVSLASKKTSIANLNRSLASRNPNSKPTFTTRYQQIGFDPRKGRPVQKPVWQSGEDYTLQAFEAHAKLFEKNYLKKCGKKLYSALEIETLFWRASVDKPFNVEYANDMPGSAFVPLNKSSKCLRETGDGVTVGDTAWNMRGVARSKGSLLRFMKEEIPGVTSPMVYIAMLFSWFAWHVEDHDLHSLNYMHMGAPKTWYGVPKDAAFAFQDVVRVQGYGGDFNPLVTVATLGEKTTVMSPEVLIGAGIPCCRLVQNVGDFVVTFPGAYHSGFSHGFNFAEASNIATPEWLRYAKEAAIRRASVNCAPMVSHYQLLYAFALALCSRVPMSISNEPRSSRLKDKKRGEGEGMVKDFFLQSVMQNNELLHILSSDGSPCVLLPRHSSEIVQYSDGGIGTEKVIKHRMLFGFCSSSEASKCSRTLVSNEISNSMFMGDGLTPLSVKQSQPGNVDLFTSVVVDTDIRKNGTPLPTGLLEQARFPCVQCGILSFAGAAIIQPREAAAQYLMSVDCSFVNEWKAGSRVLKNESAVAAERGSTFELNCTSSVIESACQDGLYEVPVKSGDCQIQVFNKEFDVVSHTGALEGISSLDLLASAYGNSSESDEEQAEPELAINDDIIGSQSLSGDSDDYLTKSNSDDDSSLHSLDQDCQDGACGSISNFSFCQNEASVRNMPSTSYSSRKRKWTSCDVQGKTQQTSDYFLPSDMETLVPLKFRRLEDSGRDTEVVSGRMIMESETNETLYTNQIECDPANYTVPSSFCPNSNLLQVPLHGEITMYSNTDLSIPKSSMSLMQISNECCRKHIFCLEHAVEVEKQLRPIGGANILLLCHPEYPQVEEAAKLLAQDLGTDHLWKDIPFQEATKENQEAISLALHDEEADPSNGDWAVKLGINLYHSVQLSKSPLYSKQMPHNSIIYKAFGCSLTDYPLKTEVSGKVPGRQKKIVVAGKWCGKVWTSNQVHPCLNQRENKEDDSVSYHVRGKPSLKSYLDLERKVEKDQPVISEKRSLPRVTTTITRKLGKKKKTISGKLVTEKTRTPELESPTQSAEESPESDSSLKSNARFLRNGKTEHARSLPQKSQVKNIRQHGLNPTVKFEGRPTVAGKRRPKNTKLGNEAGKFEKSPQVEPQSQTTEASSESSFDSDSSPLTNGRFLKEGRTKSERSLLQCGTVNTINQNELNSKDEIEGGPSTRLRRRPAKPVEEKTNTAGQKLTKTRKMNKPLPIGNDTKNEGEYQCDMEGCTMSFTSKQELALHKKNICSFKGCGKKFFSHKYLVQHRRVHIDDRPLKCPWKGCNMTFKWAWARTEHIRVHTGDRPYKCGEKGCGQTFRFVSDFSRHKRKTGHIGKGKK